MPLDPKIEQARPPRKRYRLTRRQFAWLTFLRISLTAWMLLSAWSIATSSAAWWAKLACVIPFYVFVHAFAKDNVSDPS